MNRISIELVPRSFNSLEDECLSIVKKYPFLDTLNIPDIMRMPIRSWDACRFTSKFIPNCIPHIRAIDFDINRDQSALDTVEGFSEVLVVSGDPPHDFSREAYPTTSAEMIAYLKSNRPDIKVFAAIDPYRSGIKQEMEYVKRKGDAGADGFFTQPFFSLDLMKVYGDLLVGTNLFWGVSPVIGQKSRNYWESTNRAVFPSNYDFSLDGNQEFGCKALDFANATNTNVYFMPIRMKALKYLSGILDNNAQMAPGHANKPLA